ncbi:MAG: hotdog fold thioesterase [Gilvibacter sp.]
MNYNKEEILKRCNEICQNTLMETLKIEFVDLTHDTIIAQMPVTSRVHQPDGVLHGGASVALAESVGSAGAFVFLGRENMAIRGIEISANHVKSIREGFVFAKAKVIHNGRTTQLWQIRITDKDDNLISMVKLTTLALQNK